MMCGAGNEALHLGVSLGGVEVDGCFAKDAGNSCEKTSVHVSAACRNVAEPETESFHLGVSLGGLEADGGVTKDAVWNCYCRLPCKKA